MWAKIISGLCGIIYGVCAVLCSVYSVICFKGIFTKKDE